MRVLVTGASGFIGGFVASEISRMGHDVRAVYRSEDKLNKSHFDDAVLVENFEDSRSWDGVLQGIDVVVHTAGKAHMKNGGGLEDYRSDNIDATLALAKKSAEFGVGRFIFISTIGVNGDKTNGYRFKADDLPNPKNAYSKSKLEAEIKLKELLYGNTMGLVIIRPALVYGYGAPGNFSKLVQAVECKKILPLGLVKNKRTFVGLKNLSSLIFACIEHPNAVGEIFLAGDAEDISTTELLVRLGRIIGVKNKLIPVPVGVIRFAAGIMGKLDLVDKVCSDLQIDISKNKEVLGWIPPLSLQEGLELLVKGEI